MARAASIMVTSFHTAFVDFVHPESIDICTNPDNCRSMLEHIYREGKGQFLMGGDQGFLCWQETEEGSEIMAIHCLIEHQKRELRILSTLPVESLVLMNPQRNQKNPAHPRGRPPALQGES